ncbi:serine/threonine protein kinase [Calothrix sp. PCC 6303]|uniref:serine/threonine protein kinase n=1 Tax=Calothrix sp. PCC 6303 TaxID=1170562 RepID=UPI0002A02687|nr:serine/threonine protein kinase [Calothrix sp. PCC 6303]AFZ03926.1 serine/threonine protein kinase [Calothrix sp. PCC 6303]
MIGRLLDQRYQVVEVLGRGGFGHTYIGQDTRRPGNPTCVVKQLKPATDDPEFLHTARRLFNSEAETLEKLGKHDQIPQLLAYFEQEGEFFLVQEFIPGHPLSEELIPGMQWSAEQVTHMLWEVLSILEFIHNNGVIHRDIKPDNIIRRKSDNKLVLVDFGAVKQVKMHSLMTQELQQNPTVAIGTPGYMPSEQGQGRPRPSSDIYALGIIGVQALTGLHPTQLPEDPETGELIWQNYAQSNKQLIANITKMVRHYFKYRYQSATEALQALASSSSYTSQPLVAIFQQKGNQCIQKVYQNTLLALRSLQKLAKPAYIPPTNPNTLESRPTATLARNVASPPTHQQQSTHNLQLYSNSLSKFPYKLPLLIGSGLILLLIVGNSISGNNKSQQTPISNAQNQTQTVPTNKPEQAKTEEKNNCFVVTSSSNLRSTSGRRRTGEVIKAGTKVTITGKEEGGWLEISAPQEGWIWKSRTKKTCN